MDPCDTVPDTTIRSDGGCDAVPVPGGYMRACLESDQEAIVPTTHQQQRDSRRIGYRVLWEVYRGENLELYLLGHECRSS